MEIKMETEDEYSLPLMQSKIDVQNQLISLLQMEIEMQNEKICLQDAQIKDLSTKLQAIQEQVGQLVSQTVQTDHVRVMESIARNDKQNACTADSSSGMQNTKSESEVQSSVPDAAPLSVAEMARQTAESVAATSGFVYDENSVLYYDYSTGYSYHYDPNRKLYYNGHTRTYYTYDETTNEYSFHSQLPPETSESQQLNVPNKSTKKKTLVVKHQSTQSKTKSPKPKTKGAEDKETEEGEISVSSIESDNDSDVSVCIIERPPVVHEVINVDSDSDESISEKENTPCVPVIVQSSEGTLSRNKNNNVIVIPEPGVSAKIYLDLVLGHRATRKDEPETPIGFAHDWEVFMCTEQGQIQAFVDRVIFHVYDGILNPRRVVKKPPFRATGVAYGGFHVKVEVFFKSEENPRKMDFQYNVYMACEEGPICKCQNENIVFNNPSEEFTIKLLEGGGVMRKYTDSSSHYYALASRSSSYQSLH